VIKTLVAALFIVGQSFHPMHGVQGKIVLGSELIQKNVPNMKLGRVEQALLQFRIGAADRLYFAPNANEVYGLIQNIKNDMVYTPEVYDCDDYSYWFKAELQRQWRKAGHDLPLPIIQIFGVIQIHQTGEVVGHAWNGLVTSDGTVVWIEPQGPMVMNAGRFDILEVMTFWI
jgi:hypothetical protein